MELPKTNNYKIQIVDSCVKCISMNGNPTPTFISPDTTAKLAKLYVVKNGREIYYVGMTRQSISNRLRYGFNAKGENGLPRLQIEKSRHG